MATATVTETETATATATAEGPRPWQVHAETETPDYYCMTEAERVAEAERLRQEKREQVRRLKMKAKPENFVEWQIALYEERAIPVIDFDPKQGGKYYNRPCFKTSDLDEESPFGPQRYTHKYYKEGEIADVCEAVNILSIKISSSDVGFPIQVYGTVIARDSVDYKCLYLFRRDRDHCQLISSKDEQLILVGPKRGLMLLDDNYVETDLKIKSHQGQDRELSKGYLTIRSITGRTWEIFETRSIATRLSTVDVMYAVVKRAVEGSIAIKVEQGEFYGTVTAHTFERPKQIVLYDSKVAVDRTGDDHGLMLLMRNTIPVYWKDVLVIVVKMSDGNFMHLQFDPMAMGLEKIVTTLGAVKMRVTVFWSVM